MNTPICDFVRCYSNQNPVRLHMPGHKGVNILGFEKYDITEISGADSLYEADGIIKESEYNAGVLFGSHTFYSTEGSSLSIRAMLYLACCYATERGESPLILAGRNAHKVFLSAAALLDFEVEWLYPANRFSYLSCEITAEYLEKILLSMSRKPIAVYITSPDYLGNESDIKALSAVCHKYGVLLLVDNAHGAYLKFLPESRHPVDLGADMCCDSAHKTLPVITGGAYLHISENAPLVFKKKVKDALALFGSTSPSYLILQSLDAANKYIEEKYIEELASFIDDVNALKSDLVEYGYVISGSEELKITIHTKLYGYTGTEFALLLEKNGIYCEFCDPDFVVLMLTPQLRDAMQNIRTVLLSLPRKEEIKTQSPKLYIPEIAMSIRTAYFSSSKIVDVESAVGKVFAEASVSCPPAVPILVSGEIISAEAVNCFKYYGIDKCSVIE